MSPQPIETAADAIAALADLLACGAEDVSADQTCALYARDLHDMLYLAGSGDTWANAYADAARRVEHEPDAEQVAAYVHARERREAAALAAKQPGRLL